MSNNTIWKASLNGTDMEVLHSTNLPNPQHLVLHFPTQTLFWTDREGRRIERSNLDGTGRMIVAELSIQPIFISISNSMTIYFSASGETTVRRLDDEDGNSTIILSRASNGGFQVVDPLRQLSGMIIIHSVTMVIQ